MHWLTHFGTLPLPQYDVQWNAGPAPAAEQAVALVGGGAYDPYGTGVSPQRYPNQIRYQCSVVGPQVASGLTQVNALKALIGTKAKLWRTEVDGIGRKWAYARLIDVDDTMRARMPMWIAPMTLTFNQLGRWHGKRHQKRWRFDDGYRFDDSMAFDSDEQTVLASSPLTVVVDNDGNQAVSDVVIYVTAAIAPITKLEISMGDQNFYFQGSLAVGDVLMIDCGAKRITNDGLPAWNNFYLTGNHKTAEWLTLQPGDNSVIVTTTGGGTTSTIEFVLYDGWA